MKLKLITAALTCLYAGLARADFNPVALTPGSYTFDIVVEKTAPAALPYCLTATQGGGTTLGDTTWFEQGFWRSPNQEHGLPHPGEVFTNQSNANITYIMPPSYLTNNCLLADATATGGTLTLAAPTTASGLSFFGSSGGGAGTVNYIVTHADNTTDTGTFTYNDWFDGDSPAWTALGRVGPNGGPEDDGENPRLYSAEVSVANTSPVVNVNFTYGGGGTPGIYAISISTDGTTYTPVVVSGFNEEVIVPAAFPLTATMDQGTNTVDNGNLATWFESGYVTNNPAYGLPLSGSVFDSQSQPTHHYQMGDYTTNNAVLIDQNHLTATITPATATAYTAFALLTAGGNIGSGNKMTNICVLQHADGSSETNEFIGYDWFEGGVPSFVAFVSNGRVNMHDRTVNALGSGNPKLFETYFVLTNSTSPVTNIVLQYKSAPAANSTTYIMAVSATSGGIAPVVNTEPQSINTYVGSTVQFGVTLTAGTTPVYEWQKGASPNGPFTSLTDGGSVVGSTTPTLTLTNISAGDAGYYEAVITNAFGATTSTPVSLYLLTSTLTNILLPSDSISDASFLNSIPSNAGEGASSAIDHTTTKYLCFGSGPTPGSAPFQGPVGFIVTPGLGNSVVSALRIYTSNDSPERDPTDLMLEGSTDGGNTWATILADTTLALPDARNPEGLAINPTNQVLQEVDFANTNGYTSYRVTINNVKTNEVANSMAVAEIELLGTVSGPPVVVLPYTLSEDNVALLGSTAKLSVALGGSAPFTLQWTFNGTNLVNNGRISGAQSNVLTISNVLSSDSGYYQLNITNAQGAYSVYPGGGADQNLSVSAGVTFFTNGVGYTTSGNPALTSPLISGNLLTLTDGGTGEARAAFFGAPVYIGAFKASFVYQDVNAGGADGIALVLQNDPRGAAALGGGGGGLGLSGITPSAALTLNVYSGSPGGAGISFGTGGANGSPYNSTTPVDISNGDLIAVALTYQNGTAAVTLTDTVTSNSFSTNFVVGNLTTLLGASTAYVGFTGGDGGIASTQTVTDFSFVPVATLTTYASGGNLVLTWPLQPGGYVLQSEPVLGQDNWQPVTATVTQVNGENEVTLPITAGTQFYRLFVPVPPQ